MGLVNEFSGLKDIEFGKIEILRNFSFFEVDSEYASLVLKVVDGQEYRGRKISVEVAESKGRVRSRDKGEKKRFGEKKKFGKEKDKKRDRRKFDERPDKKSKKKKRKR